MELRQLKYFLAVADARSFVAAAETLFISRQAISKSVAQLEQELKFPLFERIGRKNYLTAGGQEFLPHAVEIMHIMQKAKVTGQDPGEVEGTLRIGSL